MDTCKLCDNVCSFYSGQVVWTKVSLMWTTEEKMGNVVRDYIWSWNGFSWCSLTSFIEASYNHRVEFHWISVTGLESIIKELSGWSRESDYWRFEVLLKWLCLIFVHRLNYGVSFIYFGIFYCHSHTCTHVQRPLWSGGELLSYQGRILVLFLGKRKVSRTCLERPTEMCMFSCDSIWVAFLLRV